MSQIKIDFKKSILFSIIMFSLGCSDKKEGMNCENLKKELSLPMFLILDKNVVNSNNDKLKVLFKKIDENDSDNNLITELENDLEISYSYTIKEDVFVLLFKTEFNDYEDFIDLSYNHTKELITKFKDKKLEDFDKDQLKYLLFKKIYLHKSIYNSWFFDAPLIEFNKGILSKKGKEILSSYYDNGKFVNFKEDLIDDFIKNVYFEENFIEIDNIFYSEIILESKSFNGECKSLFNLYDNLYKSTSKKDYIIVLYNL